MDRFHLYDCYSCEGDANADKSPSSGPASNPEFLDSERSCFIECVLSSQHYISQQYGASHHAKVSSLSMLVFVHMSDSDLGLTVITKATISAQ